MADRLRQMSSLLEKALAPTLHAVPGACSRIMLLLVGGILHSYSVLFIQAAHLPVHFAQPATTLLPLTS